ncbi:MAG: flagellar basal body-associated FliL family protein [Candidatus Manganitrophus sp.]|nr:flagellar basal body-associated FliL family protein [Candidatus Manganitrophus sp.]WDT72427.1 MAG: flagellar basal body-associated FliL family protein [Candidatus Manganitrophus sp.]WDT80126.1 MAG: flagellar basal body-associated FliL family protein [Candidatus Manganitrophus sp.]
MAEEEKKGEADKADKKDAKPPAKSKKMLFIIVGAVILLAAGGGVFFMMKKPSEETVAVVAAEEADPPKTEKSGGKAEAAGGEKTEEKGGVIFDLDPFVVNLADTPEIRYLKLTIKLELAKEEYTEEVTKRMPQIRDSLLILFSSKEYASIRTVEGKMELRDEILQRLNTILKKGAVKAAYFTDFVAQ